MDEEQDKLEKWIAYLKEVNAWDKPRISYAYLCDKYAEDAETIILYKDILLSEAGCKIVQQADSGNVDVKDIYNAEKNNVRDRQKLVSYINVLCRVFGVSEELKSDTVDFSVGESSYRLNLEKKEKSAEEYYQMACAQKTNRGILDITLYIECMDKASEMGHARAMQYMARFYLKGKYVAQNEKKAIELYEKCAELNDGQSCYELYRYYKGKGTDRQKERHFLELASECNISAAQYELAMEYYHNATEADYRAAFSLLKKAGENGDPGAYYQMALCYRYGHGVEKDLQQAKNMLEKAANMGHSDAKKIIEQGLIR